MSSSCRIVVLISGSGSNLQALMDSCGATSPARIVAVISNRADAYGLQRAAQAGIAHETLSHRDYASREDFDQALMSHIDAYSPDLIILAGFMRILTPVFAEHYSGRLLNIHPSLLPKYKGLDTHARVLQAGDSQHGCTVHFVSAELDGGPIVLHAHTPVQTDDTPETLAQRVHQLEHQIYPQVMHEFAQGRLLCQDGRVYLDGQPLPPEGRSLEDTPHA